MKNSSFGRFIWASGHQVTTNSDHSTLSPVIIIPGAIVASLLVILWEIIASYN